MTQGRLALATDPAARYLARLALGSRPSQRSALRAAEAWARSTSGPTTWEQWSRDHVIAFRAAVVELVAPATAKRWLAALRGVLREALGAAAAEAWRDVPPVRGSRAPRGRQLAPLEIAALANAAQARGGPRGARDGAVIALLLGLGLRRVEVVRAQVEDLVDAGDALIIRGKGGRERRVPLPRGVRAAVLRWAAWRGGAPGPLLCSVYRDRIRIYPLDVATVHRIWHRAARDAGVGDATTHDGRRTFASALLDAGVDLAVVQALLGHASPATSARYDRRGDRALRAAIGRVDLLAE